MSGKVEAGFPSDIAQIQGIPSVSRFHRNGSRSRGYRHGRLPATRRGIPAKIAAAVDMCAFSTDQTIDWSDMIG
jgi:hypothetical protein